MPAPFSIECLDHVAIRAADVDESAAWYERVLGLEPVSEGQWGGVPRFLLAPGASRSGIAIFPKKEGLADPTAQTQKLLDHFAFRVSAAAYAQAKAHCDSLRVAYSEQDHEIAQSIYMRDPDGNTVELTTYEV